MRPSEQYGAFSAALAGRMVGRRTGQRRWWARLRAARVVRQGIMFWVVIHPSLVPFPPLGRGVHEVLAVGGEVAIFQVECAYKPLSANESVCLGIPYNHLPQHSVASLIFER